jgi:site-specific DNA-cytosine methylase
MKALYLCGGGGGGTLGGLSVGVEPVLNVDFNPNNPKRSHAIADAYELNIQSPVFRGTLEDFYKDDVVLPHLDFIVASLPCLNFSQARQGRSESVQDLCLAKQTVNIIERYKPCNLIFENVPHWGKSESCRIILTGLHQAGYHSVTWVLDAVNYGVPQNRKRLIMKASRDYSKLGKPKQLMNTCGWGDVYPNPDGLILSEKSNGRRNTIKCYPEDPCFTLTSGLLKAKNLQITGDDYNWEWDWTFIKRLFTFPDDYSLPKLQHDKATLLGQSIPPKFLAAVFKSFA